MERIAAETKAEKERMQAAGANSWQMRDAGKSYLALGMLTGLHPIRTKKGDEMAFAKLTDYDGEIDCTFFPKTWGVMRNQLEEGGIYAFRGKVDASRDTPSMIIDSLEDAKALENHSIQAVHIILNDAFNAETQISDLKNFLFDEKGDCSVYFHIDASKNPYVIKANDQLHINAKDETIKKLREIAFVKDVWLE